jgi:iron-sulfur cluster repair protein YtfE (RIC family)
MADLVHHIVQRYHLEARVEIARLESFIAEAILLEGRDHQVLQELQAEIAHLGEAMRAHLALEEREVFPCILAVAAGRHPADGAEQLERMKRMLEDEHEAEAGMFRRIRTLNMDFTPSPQAQGVQDKLLASLKCLAESLQRHIFLENKILFRRER